MKCYYCNGEIPEGSIFCPHCGKRIEVPKSLKCPQCNLDVPEGTEFCPNCGSPIGTSKYIVCSKCGTEIPKGGMFCPNCGCPIVTPKSAICSKCGTDIPKGGMFCPNCGNPIGVTKSTDFNQSMDEQSGKQGANNRFASKAEELYQQSKKYINEKVQPQFDERINEFKRVDWDKKKVETSSFIKEFINNPKKIGIAIKAIAFLFVFGFVIKNGFPSSIIWYVIIAAMLFVAFMGIPGNRLNKLHSLYASAALCLCLMFIASFGITKSGESQSNENPQVEFLEIIDKPETSYMVEISNIDDTREWTLIFFPANHEKTSGIAMMEPWYVGENSWADARKSKYDYEIRDNHIELFNGYGYDMSGRFNCKDLRFTIENGNHGIQLRGMFLGEERIFELNTYREKANKEKHNGFHF